MLIYKVYAHNVVCLKRSFGRPQCNQTHTHTQTRNRERERIKLKKRMDSFSEDKENVSMSAVSNSNYFSTGGKESLNNLSLNSYNILASIGNHQTPGSYGGGVDTSMNLNESFSFDGDKLQLDIYQKSIQKLAYENQQLRKRVKHLKDLARSKEEQLIETFNQACEDKMKKEEKTQIEYK